MKTFLKNIVIAVVGLTVIYVVYAWAKSREIPDQNINNPVVITPQPAGSTAGVNNTSFPLKVPNRCFC
ncbi:MAG: hypothetical protein KW804_03320 [Candidatus Doudnabacteria bacterium]|nr:hypothetical protein [Candidatus Doudnabacteria bacterium]